MQPYTRKQKILCLGLGLLLCLLQLPAAAQEKQDAGGKRVPAKMLAPEQAGILLGEGRMDLEQPLKTLNFMGLRDGDLVADIGCGNGFYTLQIAPRIGPHGAVLAVDVQQGMLDLMLARRAEAGVKNVYPILGAYDDPMLPPGKVDWLLLVDAYHEFSEPEAMLARMKESLAPGGRVLLLEYRAEQDPATIPFPIPRDHKMTIEEVMHEWIPAGFELVQRVEFLPAQHLFVFKVAGDDTRRAIRTLVVDDTPNVTTFDNKVYFAGQPTEEALKQFAELGVKTVINLRQESEMASVGFDEKDAVENAGMTYVHAPMGRGIPPDTTLRQIMDALETNSDAPVLLHCASSNRVGTIWSLFAGLRGGLSAENALSEGRAAGMHAPALEKAAREALSGN